MAKQLTIALDCDGVLFDCNSYVRRIAQSICTDRELPEIARSFAFEEAYGLSKAEMSELHDLICDSHATRDMDWLPGARLFVLNLLKLGHDVYFLTSHWRGCPNWVPDREQRLNALFPKCDVVFTHNKSRAKFDVLLDDKTETLVNVGERAVCFDQPWNQDAPNKRVRTYGEFLGLINDWSSK